MSCFVTRPAMPVPGTLLMSTLCSAAILRTTGDERVWRSSSTLISALGFSAEGAEVGGGGDGGGAGGVVSDGPAALGAGVAAGGGADDDIAG